MTRIALISDIHFGKFSRTVEFSVPGEVIIDENSGGEPLKESMVSLLKSENIEYLCIAGDLTSLGNPQEFFFCEKMILEIAEEIGIPQANILVGLGNHDIDWNISELYKKFDLSNPDFPQDLVQNRYQKIAARAPEVNLASISAPQKSGPAPFTGIVENDSFVMFVLNTGWCCTKAQAFSHGKLDEIQLKWFETQAQEYKDSPKWKIILMHHHPFNYQYHVPTIDISMIEEGSALLDIAGKNGFHLILHGHRHHPKAETQLKNGWINPITFVCAGSFAVNAKHRGGGSIPNTLHIIELTENAGVLKLKNFQYSPAQGWIPFTSNSPETPLDKTMMFGKLFSSETIDENIKKLSIGKELRWDDLDESLKFMSFDELNDRIEKAFDGSCKKIGSFPENIVLLGRDE